MEKKFIFGVATSAYQIEGTHGSFRSIWDTFSEKSGAISDGSDGTIACDHFHQFPTDIKLIKELGVSTYRLSISWARLNPKKGYFSNEGIAFYKKLFSELKKEGIRISITLYHWDMPEWIYLECGGWTHPSVVQYFLDYAKVCFREFDEFAEHFVTINEPFCVSALGYLHGVHAPGHRSNEEYMKSVYYCLLSHGAVVNYYKKHYKKEIGIVLNQTFPYAKKNDELSKLAIYEHDLFINLIYLDPLFKGDFDDRVYEKCRNHKIDTSFIKKDDLKIISTEIDFIGINYYTCGYVTYSDDGFFKFKGDETDLPKTDMGWDVCPSALIDLMRRLRLEYTMIPIYITENGAAYSDELVNNEVHDDLRISYLSSHLDEVMRVKEELNVKGYFAWSLMDNFEWSFGYEKRFGLLYVDYHDLKRYKKDSFYFYKNFIDNQK